jgi:hypothetical protein
MDLVTELLWHFKPLFNAIYYIVAGKFIPSSCTWCPPFFWLSEVAIVGFILSYMRTWGPK